MLTLTVHNLTLFTIRDIDFGAIAYSCSITIKPVHILRRNVHKVAILEIPLSMKVCT